MGQTFEVAGNHLSMNIAALTHFPEAPSDFFRCSSSGLQELLETNTILPRVQRFSGLQRLPGELFSQKHKYGPESLDFTCVWAADDSFGQSSRTSKVLGRYLVDEPSSSINQREVYF
jgi:hypothetical protein